MRVRLVVPAPLCTAPIEDVLPKPGPLAASNSGERLLMRLKIDWLAWLSSMFGKLVASRAGSMTRRSIRKVNLVE